jgi:hypothetical protein
MTSPELKSSIKTLAAQEATVSSRRDHSREESEQAAADVSHQRRILRGKLDIARAKLVVRLRSDDDGTETSGVREPRPPDPRGDVDAVQLPVPQPEDDHSQAA